MQLLHGRHLCVSAQRFQRTPASRFSIILWKLRCGEGLTRWPKRVSLLRRLELLLHGLRKAGLREPRRTPNLELDMLLVVDPMFVQDRREVHVGEVPAVERPQTVLGEMLDPFVTGPIVQVWIIWHSRVRAHRRLVVVERKGRLADKRVPAGMWG